jgi:hypothetical protein
VRAMHRDGKYYQATVSLCVCVCLLCVCWCGRPCVRGLLCFLLSDLAFRCTHLSPSLSLLLAFPTDCAHRFSSVASISMRAARGRPFSLCTSTTGAGGALDGVCRCFVPFPCSPSADRARFDEWVAAVNMRPFSQSPRRSRNGKRDRDRERRARKGVSLASLFVAVEGLPPSLGDVLVCFYGIVDCVFSATRRRRG